MTNVNLLKSVMAKNGDLNFVSALMKLLKISRSTASKCLNGKRSFNQKEIEILSSYYNLSAEEIKQIFVGE